MAISAASAFSETLEVPTRGSRRQPFAQLGSEPNGFAFLCLSIHSVVKEDLPGNCYFESKFENKHN